MYCNSFSDSTNLCLFPLVYTVQLTQLLVSLSVLCCAQLVSTCLSFSSAAAWIPKALHQSASWPRLQQPFVLSFTVCLCSLNTSDSSWCSGISFYSSVIPHPPSLFFLALHRFLNILILIPLFFLHHCVLFSSLPLFYVRYNIHISKFISKVNHRYITWR